MQSGCLDKRDSTLYPVKSLADKATVAQSAEQLIRNVVPPLLLSLNVRQQLNLVFLLASVWSQMAPKRCRLCGEIKPRFDFYCQTSSPDGRQGRCQICSSLTNREWYLKNTEKVIGKVAEWQRANRERANQTQKRHELRHPKRLKSVNKFHNAVRHGRITPATHCENCNSTRGIEAHHPDYNKPYDVVWLCRNCHRAEHVRLSILNKTVLYSHANKDLPRREPVAVVGTTDQRVSDLVGVK